MNAIAPRTAAPATQPGLHARWAPALAALGLGLAALLLVFAEEAEAAVTVWLTSTAYNHGLLIAPIAAWLGWQRRDRLAGLAPRPTLLGALLALAAGLAWFAAERLGVMEGRQFALIGLLWALALAALGWRVCRAMAAPLLYLVFLVPFGAFAVPLLQDVTAAIIAIGLDWLAIPHVIDGLLIETRAGFFHVAEACAGLRFIVAALAFGALYACVLFRSPGRRLVVMLLALLVPVLANGLRALGIVLLAEVVGSAEAAAADHVIYGWGFFSVIILLLILLGLPFREDGAPPALAPALPDAVAPSRPGRVAAVTACAVAVATAPPALATALNRAAGAAPAEHTVALVAPPGCTAADGGLRCGATTVAARLLVFPAGITWRAVSAERQRRAITGDEDLTFTVTPPGQPAWPARQAPAGAPQPGRVTATTAWLAGAPAGGLRSRWQQAANSLGLSGPRGGRPVLALVTLQPGPGMAATEAQALLDRVLAANDLAARAAAESGGR